ncbi:hypothetical protein SY2F82_43950 [Streptomyces sp. Y2F8-2]|uniref:hypothetical protein n=1 Tax=Streptomyces sp. Y2F8-2 TaxID=2759675 RepID=UPI001907967A|nr:hypothetical protein [Streptomyces sp. Y2F8-2]GHK02598.1 hypothetical protein SY2F82_43950 [Streptomyces sp. Y2F8-2]
MDTTAEYRIAAMDAEHARQVLTIYQLGIDEGRRVGQSVDLPADPTLWRGL